MTSGFSITATFASWINSDMKYSLSWIAGHLDGALPPVEALVQTITMKAFEVEGVERVNGESVLDIKVLPDRAHDALSHRGMAREIAALLGVPLRKDAGLVVAVDPNVPSIPVVIEDPVRSPRYIGVRVDGVTVSPLAGDIPKKLAEIGARSINNIVDITNFVLFDIGQPMHAFDAAKVAGTITVRAAKKGETMTTLDGKALTLSGIETVIADDEGILALAGVKGGKKAEVGAGTTSIIFESANFDPVTTRKTAQLHGIHTDASKRFENGLSSTLASEGMRAALTLLSGMCPGAKVAKATDVYPKPEGERGVVTVTLSDLNGLLGTRMTDGDVLGVLERLKLAGFTYRKEGGAYAVTPPPLRLDIVIQEDLIEEIGRHYGYDRVEATVPRSEKKGVPNMRLYYANKVRNFLTERGFSEVYTYSFSPDKSPVEVLNPVGDDRPYMRESITGVTGLRAALATNAQNAPLFGATAVDIFEFGNVFTTSGERYCLALGSSRKKAGLAATMKAALESIGATAVATRQIEAAPHAMEETDFDAAIAALPEPSAHEELAREKRDIVYMPFSKFPHIVRDIALFVPQDVSEAEIAMLIKEHAGPLVVRFSRFDRFQKLGEERISWAFRLVFQSFDRTLTDEEVNAIMAKITEKLQENSGWQVR